MDIQIIESSKTPNGTFFEASCGKTTAYVWFGAHSGTINVCCKNASNRVWKGNGRTFWSIEDALAAYKSPEMKAIIEASRQV